MYQTHYVVWSFIQQLKPIVDRPSDTQLNCATSTSTMIESRFFRSLYLMLTTTGIEKLKHPDLTAKTDHINYDILFQILPNKKRRTLWCHKTLRFNTDHVFVSGKYQPTRGVSNHTYTHLCTTSDLVSC